MILARLLAAAVLVALAAVTFTACTELVELHRDRGPVDAAILDASGLPDARTDLDAWPVDGVQVDAIEPVDAAGAD